MTHALFSLLAMNVKVPLLLATLVHEGPFVIDTHTVEESLYLIPLLPMLGALINGVLGKVMSKGSVTLVACGSIACAFVLSLMCFLCVFPEMREGGVNVLFQNLYTWFSTKEPSGGIGITVDLAYAVDRLSSILLLIITGVGFLIHTYSVSYMSEDPGYARYFAYLNLFVGMMLTLVMGANLVVMFVGWEGVGLASYLLIGFWYDDDQKAFAGRKAFIVNRIGDFGFLLGIFTLLATLGTVDLFHREHVREQEAIYTPLQNKVHELDNPIALGTDLKALSESRDPRVAGLRGTPVVQSRMAAQRSGLPETNAEGETVPEKIWVVSGPFGFTPARTQPAVGNEPPKTTPAKTGWTYGGVLTLAALLLFLGACGKSAQLPLYVWLPDAMAGPTPVSALIHAATMVTAGVYMICRMSFLYSEAPVAMLVVAIVGALTALFAAIIGTAQDDIKKVLAYSTVSQLGFMVLGAGVGAYWAASLHLFTHAFFKACLFLGAGSVMHGMQNETNIWKMGGLRKDMPVTAWTFLIATITISGVVPLSGFFSKDAILDLAEHSHLPGGHATAMALYLIGTAAATLTSFYMFRAYFLTFEGERRTMKDHHAHESPLMNFSLVILAAMSVIALVWGIPYLSVQEKIGTESVTSHFTLWQEYLAPEFEPAMRVLAQRSGVEAEPVPWAAWAIAWVVALGGAGFAYWKYMMHPIKQTDLASERPASNAVVELVRHKFYVDEFYNATIVRGVKGLAYGLWRFVDSLLIDTVLVRGVGFVSTGIAELGRNFQNGRAQSYAVVMAISLAVLLFATPIHQAWSSFLHYLGL